MAQILNNTYEVLDFIGKGGMSTVFKAKHIRLNMEVAVKAVRKDQQIDLLAEVSILTRLNHPNLVRVIDIFEDEKLIYIVMDYVEGEDLQHIIQREKVIPEETVVEWFRTLADTLRYLHSRKPPIIYRDMKPANVILQEDGTLKVIDFGIAREYKAQATGDTTYIGTNGFAAPEQFGMAQSDGRTDIYSLGMTMYYLATGKSPLQPPYGYTPARRINPNISERLEAILEKCIKDNPEDRYQSAEELLMDLYDGETYPFLTNPMTGTGFRTSSMTAPPTGTFRQGMPTGTAGFRTGPGTGFRTGPQGGNTGFGTGANTGFRTGTQGGNTGFYTAANTGFNTGTQPGTGFRTAANTGFGNAPQQPYAQPPGTPPAPQPEKGYKQAAPAKKSKGPLIGIIGAVAAAAVGIGIFAMGGGSSPSKSAEPPAAAAVSEQAEEPVTEEPAATPETKTAEPVPDTLTVNDGVLTVGVTGYTFPYSYEIGDEIIGYDIKLAELIADRLNCDLEIVQTYYSDRVDKLNNGEIDIYIGETPKGLYTDEMLESDTYYRQAAVFAFPEDSGDIDLDNFKSEVSGLNVTVSDSRDYLTEYAEGLGLNITGNFSMADNYDDIIADVNNGKYDCALMMSEEVEYIYFGEHRTRMILMTYEDMVKDGLVLDESDSLFYFDEFVITAKLGNTNMISIVNEVLSGLNMDVELEMWVESMHDITEKLQ
ncbi:MAG: protein kinase [Solobacterium sp.]|nr:protein kinase [Solobacterium sp.]